MAKPIKSLEFHYPMIQFLVNIYIYIYIYIYIPHDVLATCVVEKSHLKSTNKEKLVSVEIEGPNKLKKIEAEVDTT